MEWYLFYLTYSPVIKIKFLSFPNLSLFSFTLKLLQKMDRLNQIKKKQSVKIIEKQKSEQLKGGGVGNFERKEGKKCPPPFEPDWKN
jgi:hypothetical protein